MIVDASVWVSRIISSDVNHQISERWLTRAMQRGAPIVIPSIAPIEVAGAVARRTNEDFAISAAAGLMGNRLIEIVELSREAEDCVRVAARLRLRGMDAIYVALAGRRGLPLITWDEDVLARAAGSIQVGRPSD